MIREITPAELAAWRGEALAAPASPRLPDDGTKAVAEGRRPPLVVDVREPWELERCAMADAIHVPMHELPGRLGELPRDRAIVVVCHHGVRSRLAAHFLARAGFSPVCNLAGGVAAWAQDVDPAMPRY